MSLMDSPAFHLSQSSFLRAADNLGRPRLATPIPPIRTTPKTLPRCTDRLNPPCFSSGTLILSPRGFFEKRCRYRRRGAIWAGRRKSVGVSWLQIGYESSKDKLGGYWMKGGT